ncbi:Uncharacterised protein [Vibrio cholerae]|nr:Uncharacterised protein [Vibrio cholerae]CSI64945.1 Uncharacterised protein [Vibrio cholerae]
MSNVACWLFSALGAVGSRANLACLLRAGPSDPPCKLVSALAHR